MKSAVKQALFPIRSRAATSFSQLFLDKQPLPHYRFSAGTVTLGKEMFGQDQYRFLLGAADKEQFPRSLAALPAHPKYQVDGEVGFVGRSNVGKSSLLNAIMGSKLAITSSQPGRTQQINFFANSRIGLVDLPGYGYGKAPLSVVEKWNLLMGEYVRGRSAEGLRRLFVLIDSRHGLMPIDMDFVALLDEFNVPYQVVLTKTDRLKITEFYDVVDKTCLFLEHRPSCYPFVTTVSAECNFGVSEMRQAICSHVLMQGHDVLPALVARKPPAN